MKLTNAEERLMEFIWKEEKLFMKDLIDCFPEPKPATTTVATMLKRMQEKGFVAYETFGNSRRYYPLIEKDAYFSRHVKGIINQFFDQSPLKFASFFTKSGALSNKDLESLQKIIADQIKKEEK